MIYYDKNDYSERYYIDFLDIDGNEWHVSIQDPTGSFTPIELTGASNPVEWMGVGDEEQTRVVLGSTGTLRLVCTEETQNEFALGAIFPNVINDRRVVVSRNFPEGGQDRWFTMWQGFIKPEQYTQNWDRTPHEIELPIISLIAATEFFLMPDYDQVQDKETIADLIWYIFDLLGCNVNKLITNKPVYEDFNGLTQEDDYGRPYHWTQGVASPLYFYELEGDGAKPKTLKDVLETICYPYGKVNDCMDYVTVLMVAGKWISGEVRLYELDMDRTSINYHRFVAINGNQGPTQIDISSLQIASTDNSTTLIAIPASVNFSNTVNVDGDVMEISEKYIKSSLPFSVDILDDTSKVTKVDLNATDKYTYHFTGEYVERILYTPVYEYGMQEGANDPLFCRVVVVSTSDGGYTYSYNLETPLAFYIPKGYYFYAFDVPTKIKSFAGRNKVKVSFDVYSAQTLGKSSTGEVFNNFFLVMIIDVDENKYLDLSDRQWKPLPANYQDWSWKSVTNLTDCKVTFNEPRNSSDKSLHTLRFAFTAKTGSGYGSQYDFYIKPKIEYVRDDAYTKPMVVGTFIDTLINAGNKSTLGSSGEVINVDFKTMCGRTSTVVNGNGFIPNNSFCDSQNYIDIGNRRKIELAAVKLTADFIAKPFHVNDGQTVYFPVAIGINAIDNTLRVTLVSTNIGTTQPE